MATFQALVLVLLYGAEKVVRVIWRTRGGRAQGKDHAQVEQNSRKERHGLLHTTTVATAVTTSATAQMTFMLIHALRRKRRPRCW